MLRIVPSVAALLLAIAATPAFSADWMDEGDWEYDDGIRGSVSNEPKDWSGLGDETDPLSFEFGTRYWYSMGAHRMTVLDTDYVEDDTSHIIEGHLRITDHSSDVFVKGIAGYSAVINSTYSTPVDAGSSQAGRIMYAGADIGYTPLGDGTSGFGGFVGYQYWQDSPDMGEFNFTSGGGFDSNPNEINYNLFKLGLVGRLDFDGVADITAEVAAIPYAPVWGTYGALAVPLGPGQTQTSSGNLGGWLYGASAEVMGRFHPTENWTVGLGGRAWYLTGQADVRFSADLGGGNTNYITKTTNFSTFRYGLLGEVSYRF